jgi:release factor glutamine methyltransferase
VTLSEYKKKIIQQLSENSTTAQLDAELLLMHVLDLSRTELLMRSRDALQSTDEKIINDFLERRLAGEPMAYLLGSQPFWTMDLIVTEDTLIPRPETECLVDWILHHFSTASSLRVADLGTGTGAIAIALATEKKQWHIDAVDFSAEALAIAKKNADNATVKNVSFYVSDWFDALANKKYDVIVSNPPYISDNDPHLAKLQFEPQSALVSGKNGLDDIEKIVQHAKHYLSDQGVLIIEHGFDQAESVRAIFEKNHFQHIQNHRDLSDVPRFVTGRC